MRIYTAMKNDKRIKRIETSKSRNLDVIRKTFQRDGHWIERPKPTEILVCICGNRYIKTRLKQLKCLRCLSQESVVER